MSDEDRRRRERSAKKDGDEASAAAVERDRTRLGEGLAPFLDALVGTKIYVEGIRINYRGTLREILYHWDRRPAGFVLEPCQRISYLENPREKDGGYTYTHVGPLLIPYETVHGIGPEGFVGVKWQEIGR